MKRGKLDCKNTIQDLKVRFEGLYETKI